MRGIHRWPANSPHKGQWRGALMFSLIWAWTNSWANTGDAGDLRCHRAHYDVIAMLYLMWNKPKLSQSVVFHAVDITSKSFHQYGIWLNCIIIPSAQRSCWGYIGFTPSVRPASGVRSVAPTVLVGSISCLCILSSNPEGVSLVKFLAKVQI